MRIVQSHGDDINGPSYGYEKECIFVRTRGTTSTGGSVTTLSTELSSTLRAQEVVETHAYFTTLKTLYKN
jgi:hypothetical protein